MKKTRFRFFKSKWFWIVVAIIVILIAYGYFKSQNKAPTFQTAAAQIGTVVERVSVTGTVSPVGKADLSFEKGGTVSKIYVQVGQEVHAGDAIAKLDSASDQASYDSAAATLGDLSRSLTPTEQAVQDTTLSNADRAAYAKAQSALVSYADGFFTNPQSSNPVIDIRADSSEVGYRLNHERSNVTDILTRWSNELAGTTDIATQAGDATGYLSTIKDFFNDLSNAVNALNPGNSGLTQNQIDADVTAMNTGLSNLNDAINSLTTALSDYNLKIAGNSSQSIAAQAAKVAQAKAVLDQDTLVSPIDGVVTLATPNLGEYVAPGQTQFAIQNDQFKIEAYVPEADIAKVAVGDLASTTLDAYGAYVDFPTKVIMIDPAETVLEGVPTYKITLQFVTPDSRIRSGMTANLEILTRQSPNVVEVPYRAVTTTATSSTVRLVSADGKSYASVPVVVGLKGSDGTIEIVSGLSEGDRVVTYVK